MIRRKALTVVALIAVALVAVVTGIDTSRFPPIVDVDTSQSKPLGGSTFLIRGSHANAWNAAAVGIAGKSTALDSQWATFCSAFGNTSGASTLTVEFSADNSNWYATATNTGSITGNFGINFQMGARYVRLSSSAAVTITATLQCKSS